jgi:hypothetical protein
MVKRRALLGYFNTCLLERAEPAAGVMIAKKKGVKPIMFHAL